MDLLFIVDRSGSIESSGKGNFDKVKNFVEDLTQSFGVSKEGTHVGIIAYSDKAEVGCPQRVLGNLIDSWLIKTGQDALRALSIGKPSKTSLQSK